MNLAPLDFRLEYSKIILEAQKQEPEVTRKESKKIPSCEKLLWRKYRKQVWDITKQQKIHKLPNYELRAFKGYHLDHKVSIWYGYKLKLDAKMIGGIDNLEFIPYKKNMIKGVRCNFDGFKGAQHVLFTDSWKNHIPFGKNRVLSRVFETPKRMKQPHSTISQYLKR